MKVIKHNSQIVSLENIQSIHATSFVNTNCITVTYMSGYMGSNGHFYNHTTEINYVKNPQALLEKIYEILKEKD